MQRTLQFNKVSLLDEKEADSSIYQEFASQCQQNFDRYSAHNMSWILGAADFSYFYIPGKNIQVNYVCTYF